MNHQHLLIRRWAFFFTTIYSIFLISYGILSIQLFKYQQRSDFQEHSQFFLLLGSASILALNLACFLFPNILYGYPRIRMEDLDRLPKVTKLPPDQESAILQEQVTNQPVNIIKNEAILLVEGKLISYIEEKRPWTTKKFSIASLSDELQIPEHHLRYYLISSPKSAFPLSKQTESRTRQKSFKSRGRSESFHRRNWSYCSDFRQSQTFSRSLKKSQGSHQVNIKL